MTKYVIGLWLVLYLPCAARATVLDADFSELEWLTGVSTATGMVWASDGSNRLFVATQYGHVRVIEDGVLLETPFVVETVFGNGECGMIGIALDPDFARNQYVYVFATVADNEQQIIRYTAEGNLARERTVIVRGLPTLGGYHDGGAIGFGPDGMLYWGIGDLANGIGVDDDLSSLAAKVGRARRDGSVPNDNPFFDADGPNADLIWARGFRNPFTFQFQPGTGRLWVSSVGTYWEQIFAVTAGEHAGYRLFENNQPSGYLAPIVAYNTNTVASAALDPQLGASRTAGVVTFTTTLAHPFRRGAKASVTDVMDTSFNGEYFVTSVPSATQFTVAQPGADAMSGGGSARTLDIGGSITGGAFWDSSAVPATHRGDFFFGDFNSGRIERVALDEDGSVAAVDHWALGMPHLIDIELGPDGALYAVTYEGTITRLSARATAQALIVTPLHLRMDESGQQTVSVRLATAPNGPVTVNASLAGDEDISLLEGNSVLFDTSDWAVPKTFRLAARQDRDDREDLATLTLSAENLAAEAVEVRATDSSVLELVLKSNALEVTEGEMAMFEVALSQAPEAALEVHVMGDAQLSIVHGAVLTFTPANWSTPQWVTVAAAQDDDNDDASVGLQLSAAGLPQRHIQVSVRDDDNRAPRFTSKPPTRAVVNVQYMYAPKVSGSPKPELTLVEAPEGMTLDDGRLAWLPLTLGRYEVEIRAANGVEPDATQELSLDVAMDQPPTCTITKPLPGDELSGANAEFFGDVTDDVAPVRAEFRINSLIVYSEENTSGHYHAGGGHNRFDTTSYGDGPHELVFVGYDTIGQSCTATVQITFANHRQDPEPTQLDAGPRVPSSDAGTPVTRRDGGCDCQLTRQPKRAAPSLLFIVPLVALARRSRRTRRSAAVQEISH